MKVSSTFRRVAVMAIVALAMLATAATASATSSTGNQNPTLVVNASLVSSGVNPDVATLGDTISANLSVTNAGPRQWVRVFWSASLPTGPLSYDKLMMLPAGKTRMLSASFPVLGFTPLGTYSISIAALGAGFLDPSQADASITIM